MSYNPNYTEAILEKEIKWFAERMDRLPQTLQINGATHTEDLRRTVESLIKTLRSNRPGVVFSGYFHTLTQIHERLEEQGISGEGKGDPS